MKKKIRELLENIWDEIEYCLRLLCGQPSPMKRFIIVVIIGGSLSVAFICTLVNSIYNIGANDARKEFLELQHIEQSKLLQEDSTLSIKKYK